MRETSPAMKELKRIEYWHILQFWQPFSPLVTVFTLGSNTGYFSHF